MSNIKDKYKRPSYGRSQAIAVENLSDAEIEAIGLAEPPAEAARYDHELTVEEGADT